MSMLSYVECLTYCVLQNMAKNKFKKYVRNVKFPTAKLSTALGAETENEHFANLVFEWHISEFTCVSTISKACKKIFKYKISKLQTSNRY